MLAKWTTQGNMLGIVLYCLPHIHIEMHYSDVYLASLRIKQLDYLCMLH